jgi:AmmeMemoRadiSam system protein B
MIFQGIVVGCRGQERTDVLNAQQEVMMTSTRPPAVAGSFYSADAKQLHALISSLLRAVPNSSGDCPKAIIVPHAGYIYSGAIAASAYAHVALGRDRIRRVVLLGPAHRFGFHGLALSSADFFATPLGSVPLDRSVVATLLSLPGVQTLDKAHALEHSLEVQIPFLQEVLQDFFLVPMVVGDAPAEVVATVIEQLWGGDETLVVISSDLSHYQDYATAKQQDAATSLAIENLHPEKIAYHDACGRLPVNGLLLVAKKLGLTVTPYDLRNSGDTAGDRDRVVGYGAYGFA